MRRWIWASSRCRRHWDAAPHDISFLDALAADGPSADRAGKMDLYGRFVGSWDLDVRQFSEDGTERRRAGEWHFGWALEGRAIQDVWIVPPRGKLRHGDAAANINSYGTTLRIYDPDIDAWRIQWTDPVTRNFLQMIGRAEGSDIVQLGTRPDGQLARWSFTTSPPNYSSGAAKSRRMRARHGASSPSSPPATGKRDLSHRLAPASLLASACASEWRRDRGRQRMRNRTMTGADKFVCHGSYAAFAVHPDIDAGKGAVRRAAVEAVAKT